jgi:hypothetical protein
MSSPAVADTREEGPLASRATFKSASAAFLICLLAVPPGCAPSSGSRVQLPRESERAAFGTVTVVGGGFAPEVDVQGGSGVGRGTLRGAKKGAKTGAIVGAGVGCFLFYFLCPLGAAAGAVAGGLSGGGTGAIVGAATAEAVGDPQEVMARVIDSVNLQDDLRQRIAGVGERRMRRPFRATAAPGPTTAGEEPRYAASALVGIDTVVETRVLALGFIDCRSAVCPLVLRARARAIRVTDGAALYDQTYEYRSGAQANRGWAAQDARAFRDEIDNGLHYVTQLFALELFGSPTSGGK